MLRLSSHIGNLSHHIKKKSQKTFEQSFNSTVNIFVYKIKK